MPKLMPSHCGAALLPLPCRHDAAPAWSHGPAALGHGTAWPCRRRAAATGRGRRATTLGPWAPWRRQGWGHAPSPAAASWRHGRRRSPAAATPRHGLWHAAAAARLLRPSPAASARLLRPATPARHGLRHAPSPARLLRPPASAAVYGRAWRTRRAAATAWRRCPPAASPCAAAARRSPTAAAARAAAGRRPAAAAPSCVTSGRVGAEPLSCCAQFMCLHASRQVPYWSPVVVTSGL